MWLPSPHDSRQTAVHGQRAAALPLQMRHATAASAANHLARVVEQDGNAPRVRSVLVERPRLPTKHMGEVSAQALARCVELASQRHAARSPHENVRN